MPICPTIQQKRFCTAVAVQVARVVKASAVLIVPASRRRTAERLLQGAKLTTTMVPPPDADAINKRNNDRILNDPSLL